MRIFRFVIAIALLSLVGCRKEVEQLTEIVSLSQSQKTALERIIEASKSNLEVDAIQYVEKSNKYIVTLSDGNSTHIELYNGQGDFQYESLYFESITIEANGVMFILTDGSQIFLPFNRRISLTFEEYDLSMARSGSTATICYTLKSAFEVDSFDIYCSTDVVVENNSYNAKTQQGELSVVIPQRVNSSSKLVVVASNGQCATMAAIRFESTRAYSFNNSIKSPATSGGEYVLEYIAGAECSVTISEQGQSWISQNCNADGVVISVSANNDYYRTAQVILSQPDGACEIVYTINQDGKKGVYMNPDDMPDNEIWYTTTDGQIMTPSVAATFGAKIVSNRMESGKGVITFDAPVISFGDGAFADCKTLEKIVIPQSVESVSGGAFKGCESLTTISGKFVSSDGRAVVINGELIYVAVVGIEDYTLPRDVLKVADGVFDGAAIKRITLPLTLQHIGKRSFANMLLQVLTIPDTVTTIEEEAFAGNKYLTQVKVGKGVNSMGLGVFKGCSSLRKFTGDTAAVDGTAVVIDGRLMTIIPAITDSRYTIPYEVKSIAPFALAYITLKTLYFDNADTEISSGSLAYCPSLYNIVGSKYLKSDNSIVVDGELLWAQTQKDKRVDIDSSITAIGAYTFAGCKVKTVHIPSSVKSIGSYAFADAQIKGVILNSTEPPVVQDDSFERMNHPVIVPDKAMPDYQKHPVFSKVSLRGVYFSEDYSRHEEVVVIQQATEGAGLDLVFMGDGYTDKDVASGDYDRLMRKAADMFFAAEPYASFRHLFNVYYVNVISLNEGITDFGITAFGCCLTDLDRGGIWDGSTSLGDKYARKAIGLESGSKKEYHACILLNASEGRSCCFWTLRNGDYGSGESCSFCVANTIDNYFEHIVQHEVGGHGFAKLADEYVEFNERYYGGTSSRKNIDICSEPDKVKWSHFLQDSRYDVERLGVFEGAGCYLYGVYRSSEDSIMKHMSLYFNAPSREAIYYSIHKKAFGESWRYNYEDFVAFDAKVLAAKPWVQSRVMGHTMVLRPQELGAPPRLIKEDDEL